MRFIELGWLALAVSLPALAGAAGAAAPWQAEWKKTVGAAENWSSDTHP